MGTGSLNDVIFTVHSRALRHRAVASIVKTRGFRQLWATQDRSLLEGALVRGDIYEIKRMIKKHTLQGKTRDDLCHEAKTQGIKGYGHMCRADLERELGYV